MHLAANYAVMYYISFYLRTKCFTEYMVPTRYVQSRLCRLSLRLPGLAPIAIVPCNRSSARNHARASPDAGK